LHINATCNKPLSRHQREAPGGQPVTLGDIGGVQIVVLLRHRH
jgi:hypothetical protein